MTQHVVCHDCPFEAVELSERVARNKATDHATTTNHDVEFERID